MDLCLVKNKAIPLVNEVTIRQDIKGSDHAPLCVTMDINVSNLIAPSLLDRAKNLGQSYYVPQIRKEKQMKTKSYK